MSNIFGHTWPVFTRAFASRTRASEPRKGFGYEVGRNIELKIWISSEFPLYCILKEEILVHIKKTQLIALNPHVSMN